MKNKLIYPLISTLAGILVCISFGIGLFSGLESFFEDLLFSKKPLDSRIVIVSIDNESIEKIGQWPWPREIFAKMLIETKERPPLSMGIDVLFSEESRVGKNDDLLLKKSLEKISYPITFPIEATELILNDGEIPRATKILKPIPILQKSEKVSLGFINLIADRDGIIRRFPLNILEGDKTYKAFSYHVVKNANIDIPNKENLKNINNIVYAAPPGSMRRIPFWRILEKGGADILENKIVFVGSTAADLHDDKPTPFMKGSEMPGVEIHANIANMLIRDYRLIPLKDKISFAFIIFAALIPSLIFISFKRISVILSLILLFGIGCSVTIIMLFQNGVIANIIHINIAWIASSSSLFGYKFFIGEKEKREIKNIFSKYISKSVLTEILNNPNKITLGGEEKEITILFSDIRGFTSLSEKTNPKELVSILNRYFSVMTEEVLKQNGVLDKYIGDAIMAFWGAPLEDEMQADKALLASLGMVKRLKLFNDELKKEGKSGINIGIGIYTGPAIVGNIGSKLRFDYTTIGDTVNTSSRLEGLNKQYNTNIIIGERTKNKLKNNYPIKFLNSVIVKGKEEKLNIYTVI